MQVLATEICPLEIRTIGAGFHVMGDLCLQILFSQLTLTMMWWVELGVAGVQMGVKRASSACLTA